MKITISGLSGAGKTTVGKIIAKYFNCNFMSIGDLREEFALKNKMTIDELNEKGKTDPTVDTLFDKFQKDYGQKNNKFVVEGRLSYHFIPDSIKIFLTIDKYTGAERIFKDPRPDEKKCKTIEETIQMLEERVESDKERYWKNYKLNCYDVTQYDIVIDTTKLVQKEMSGIAIDRIHHYLKSTH